LAAVPSPGWSFVSWTGDADCADGAVTMSAPTSRAATFQQTTPLSGGESESPDASAGQALNDVALTPDHQPADYRRRSTTLRN
jgi:hypothetical protein